MICILLLHTQLLCQILVHSKNEREIMDGAFTNSQSGNLSSYGDITRQTTQVTFAAGSLRELVDLTSS